MSVIVPANDRVPTLELALASIRALEGPDLELDVIVADSSPTDSGRPAAERHGARWFRTPPPGRAAAGRSLGMRQATGDFLAFLDDDDVFLPGHLRPHLRLLDQRQELAAVVGQIQLADHDRNPIGEPYPQSLPAGREVFVRFLAQYPQLGATVVRADVRDSVGYMDTELGGDEDWDWHLRLAMMHEVGFVPVPSMLFCQQPAGSRPDLQWRRLAAMHEVFWRNVRRRPPALPSWPRLLRVYMAHRGSFADYLLHSAVNSWQENDAASGRQAVGWAFRASPPHAALRLLRDGRTLRAVAWASLPHPRRRR